MRFEFDDLLFTRVSRIRSFLRTFVVCYLIVLIHDMPRDKATEVTHVLFWSMYFVHVPIES